LTEYELKADYDRVTITTEAGTRRQVALVPDSYFAIIANQRRYPFFLELDRGKMTVKRFKEKIKAYLAYQQTGGYEKRYGTRSFRMLTVTIGEKHLLNLKTATEQVGGRDRFWFATLNDLNAESVFSADIWHVAGGDSRQLLI
jgi:hypothetical protein